jgi:hypothetical protein
MSSQTPPTRAFTVQYPGRVRQLVLPINLSEAYDPRSGLPAPSVMPFQSVWDTGASACAISSKVIASLNLKPTGKTMVQTAGGQGLANTYLINLYLPNDVVFLGVRVAEAQLVGNEDILIGMDIIGNGDFSVTNFDRKTCMSFRLPSLKRIDYVPETNKKIAFENPQARRKLRNRRKRDRSNRR